MKPDALKNCSVCESANLNKFCGPNGAGESAAWWCEDCGTMHVESDETGLGVGVWQPEKSMLHHQVMAFHKRFGQAIGEKPHVPDEKTVRFRLSLIAEEFCELLTAAGFNGDLISREIDEELSMGKGPDVDLPDFCDAVADIFYVLEGAAITMGVNMTPIVNEVHAANMRKLPSYVAAKDASHRRDDSSELFTWKEPIDAAEHVGWQPVKREDGKIGKPPGWTPPDIGEQLTLQGWDPK